MTTSSPPKKHSISDRSGWRESNPHFNLGGVARGHYATPADPLSLDDAPPDRLTVNLAYPSP